MEEFVRQVAEWLNHNINPHKDWVAPAWVGNIQVHWATIYRLGWIGNFGINLANHEWHGDPAVHQRPLLWFEVKAVGNLPDGPPYQIYLVVDCHHFHALNMEHLHTVVLPHLILAFQENQGHGWVDNIMERINHHLATHERLEIDLIGVPQDDQSVEFCCNWILARYELLDVALI